MVMVPEMMSTKVQMCKNVTRYEDKGVMKMSQVQQQADHEVQVGHEEDEEILSREKVQESCCRSEREMCGHGEASGRKA